jgi:transposase
VWLLVRSRDKPGTLNLKEQALVQALTRLCPVAEQALDLTLSFVNLVRARAGDVEALQTWRSHAEASAVPPIADLSRSVGRDLAAVLAAVSHPWSNGQTEGQVNRLKLVKRQMYGRANLDLLGARVLPLA